MQNTEGCAVFENYNIETDAVKFGDEKNSYIHMKTNFWKADYLLELEFRTLFHNGLIFISVTNLSLTKYAGFLNYIFYVLEWPQATKFYNSSAQRR